MSNPKRGWTPGPDAHELYVDQMEAGTARLLPCPFCGSVKVKLVRDSTAYLAPHDHIVLCECGACGPNTTSPASAGEKWNKWHKSGNVPFTREQLTAYANNSRNEFTSLEMQLAQALLNQVILTEIKYGVA